VDVARSLLAAVIAVGIPLLFLLLIYALDLYASSTFWLVVVCFAWGAIGGAGLSYYDLLSGESGGPGFSEGVLCVLDARHYNGAGGRGGGATALPGKRGRTAGFGGGLGRGHRTAH
jgi:hypothetical protein